MDGDELRWVQAPLKDRYRSDPAAAVITLHAEGSLTDNHVSCSVQTGHALVEAGLHPATGVMAPSPARATCSCKHSWPAPVSPCGPLRRTVAST